MLYFLSSHLLVSSRPYSACYWPRCWAYRVCWPVLSTSSRGLIATVYSICRLGYFHSQRSTAMLIATDPLSLVFIGCFVFGVLFFVITALLGNLGQAHDGTHIATHHVSIHPGGHIAGTEAHGGGHAASHGPVHASTHATGTTGAANDIQAAVQSVFAYVNIT